MNVVDLFHDLLLSPIYHCCVWGVILRTVHHLSPHKRDERNVALACTASILRQNRPSITVCFNTA